MVRSDCSAARNSSAERCHRPLEEGGPFCSKVRGTRFGIVWRSRSKPKVCSGCSGSLVSRLVAFSSLEFGGFQSLVLLFSIVGF